MRKSIYSLTIFFILSFVLFYGCSKEETTNNPTPTINEAETLVQYFEAQGDYFHNGASFVMDAATYKTKYTADPSKLYVIDIRSATDYAAKHLKGAVNVTFANILSHIQGLNLANYDNIVVACYSGQTAAYAVSLVRATMPVATGNKIVSLKWGMSSIDSSFATNYWLSKTSNAGAANVVTTAAPAKPAKGDFPTLNTGKTTGAEILTARVNDLLSKGYTPATISYSTLATNFSNYFIMNYWPNALYLNPGHINGAYNYDPTAKPLQLANDLKTLPTNKSIVMYCYTGQTSSYGAAYLRLLGYDVLSLTYGGNGFMYDLMKAANVANTFNPAVDIKGYKDLLQ